MPADTAPDLAATTVLRAADGLGGSRDWPVVAPPSHERFAALLAALHDAGSIARQAAARCDDAKRSLDSALHPPSRAERTTDAG